MVVPLILYNCTVHFNLNQTQKNKLQSLQNRAIKIVDDTKVKLANIIKKISIHTCLLVKKCLIGEVCSNFIEYFHLKKHLYNTRNNNIQVELPSIKLEFARKGFFFMGAKIYNELPAEIRQEENLNLFKNKIRNYHKEAVT